MPAFIDMTSESFGEWFVLGPWKHGVENIHWYCRCSCGEERWVSGRSLRSGKSKSCGGHPRFEKGVVSLKRKFSSYRAGAKVRGISFALPCRLFKVLVKMPCAYCGSAPSDPILLGNYERSREKCNGIDRVVNHIGYVKDNCVPCCAWCNRAKGAQSAEEFLQHCKEVMLNG